MLIKIQMLRPVPWGSILGKPGWSPGICIWCFSYLTYYVQSLLGILLKCQESAFLLSIKVILMLLFGDHTLSTKSLGQSIWPGKLGNYFIPGPGAGFNPGCRLDSCEELKKKKNPGPEPCPRNPHIIGLGSSLQLQDVLKASQGV